MGYMTTINFLNDAYIFIKENSGQVINNILDAMKNERENMKTYRIDSFCNPMQASKIAHADVPRLYLCWGNSFVEMGQRNDIANSMLDVRKKFLKKAKDLIKEEEKQIKKIEDKIKMV